RARRRARRGHGRPRVLLRRRMACHPRRPGPPGTVRVVRERAADPGSFDLLHHRTGPADSLPGTGSRHPPGEAVMTTLTALSASAWTAVCPLDRVEIERGVAALVSGTPIALFRTHTGDLHALDNVDPMSGASVLSRGIVGTRGDIPTV